MKFTVKWIYYQQQPITLNKFHAAIYFILGEIPLHKDKIWYTCTFEKQIPFIVDAYFLVGNKCNDDQNDDGNQTKHCDYKCIRRKCVICKQNNEADKCCSRKQYSNPYTGYLYAKVVLHEAIIYMFKLCQHILP